MKACVELIVGCELHIFVLKNYSKILAIKGQATKVKEVRMHEISSINMKVGSMIYNIVTRRP